MTDMEYINGQIDRLLAERRPNRYQTGVEEDWLDQIGSEIAVLIPDSEVRAMLAGDLVRQRERVKVRQGNAWVREVAESGQFPLGYVEPLPISVEKFRVSLPDATALDFEQWAETELRRIKQDTETRYKTVDAIDWLREKMIAAGVEHLRDLTLE